VIFGRNDLVKDAPISRVDLLTCRNTLMYLNAETQRIVFGRLHFAFAPHGTLFLGHAEMLLGHSDRFTPLNLKHRIFRKIGGLQLQVDRGDPATALLERSVTFRGSTGCEKWRSAPARWLRSW
jgi:two-component system, chemotaxis family, CheB/CheR fusion protein